MHVLWERSPLAADEIVDELADENDWSPRTVKTMLNRLVNKGALRFKQDGKRYLYRPAVTRDAAVKREVSSLRQRVFDGATDAMLAYLVKRERLTAKQRNLLRQILDETEDK